MKKILKIVLGVGVVVALAVYVWYQNRLDQSRATADDMVMGEVLEEIPEAIKVEYEKDQAVSEEKSEAVLEDLKTSVIEPKLMLSGEWNRVDPIHWAKGSVELMEEGDDLFVVFSEDFKTPRGPDLYVLLGNENAVQGKKFREEESINLGALSAYEGRQAYKINKDLAQDHQYQVVIWCRAFNALFSQAILENK